MSSEKSFPKGSPFPPLSKGTLRLYSMRFCPFAQRTRLVLAHKNIPHETINVDLKPEKPEWFLERNPLGLVPVLEQDGKVICESLITCDYLDEAYPQNRLTPTDPYRKARDAMLLDFCGGKVVPNFYKVLIKQGKDEESVEAVLKGLKKLEEEIGARGTFFGGDKVAMIDMMMWPWFERIALLHKYAPSVVPSESNFPKMFSWIKAMVQHPSVKATYYDQEAHQNFLSSYKDGSPNYNVGLPA